MRKQFLALAAIVPLMTLPALAAESTNGTLTISGTGSVSKAPDMAILSAGVESREKTAKAALADNNAKMEALFAELDKAGIAKKDIQTNNFNINPQLVYPRNDNNSEPKPPRIVGYQVNNRVTVSIKALDSVGSVLTALVNAGANNISGLRFDISNKDGIEDEARKAAIADARAKAELYAAELGVGIKRLKSLSEGSAPQAPRPMMMRAMANEAMVSKVPVAEGSLDFDVTVSTTWELDN
ncbi:hypothetical protein SAMN04515647_1783 [Cohaesibacter sp. ES.047]|uniref:SIMPL domain-containing protein n=1 Tax=Cohaesibacter sp. ES.047 TaxID=1798205 RepID=UPI000BB768C9|nr:SIMPL domain-containing protein [Cohaesibacter sp. ES.047]SNY91555.1 hypothetical protein SAMN04515647_1783 [Cohaesibacter sp. ES.047]